VHLWRAYGGRLESFRTLHPILNCPRDTSGAASFYPPDPSWASLPVSRRSGVRAALFRCWCPRPPFGLAFVFASFVLSDCYLAFITCVFFVVLAPLVFLFFFFPVHGLCPYSVFFFCLFGLVRFIFLMFLFYYLLILFLLLSILNSRARRRLVFRISFFSAWKLLAMCSPQKQSSRLDFSPLFFFSTL